MVGMGELGLFPYSVTMMLLIIIDYCLCYCVYRAVRLQLVRFLLVRCRNRRAVSSLACGPVIALTCEEVSDLPNEITQLFVGVTDPVLGIIGFVQRSLGFPLCLIRPHLGLGHL